MSEQIIKRLEQILQYNNDPRHNLTDPCLVCEILRDIGDVIDKIENGDFKARIGVYCPLIRDCSTCKHRIFNMCNSTAIDRFNECQNDDYKHWEGK